MLRTEDEGVTHRTIQRITYVQTLTASRIGYRFGLDQTFTAAESPVFRGRFRAVWEKGLNGQNIDSKEFFLKLGNEWLLESQSQDLSPEFRVTAVIGYDIKIRLIDPIYLSFKFIILFF